MKKPELRFADVFAGLGGFHYAMNQIAGYRGVFASEIDEELRLLYKINHGLEPASDITQVNVQDIPAHDVLCAGFPCQPFSLAGHQRGAGCQRDGRLIDEAIKIARQHTPRAIILENVPNVLKVDNGAFWNYVTRGFQRAGYTIQHKIISPVEHGIPQNRPRLFAVGFRDKKHSENFLWPVASTGEPPRLKQFLDAPSAGRHLEPAKHAQLQHWQTLLNHIGRGAVNSLAIMAPEFGATYPEDFSRLSLSAMRQHKGAYGASLSDCSSWKAILGRLPSYVRKKKAVPQWQRASIKHSRALYADNKAFLSRWTESLDKQRNSWQILEWRGPVGHVNLKDCLIQFRASGIRILKADISPSLVAMTPTQIPIIGRYMRYMTVKEAACLQSLDKLPSMLDDRWKSFKAMGNAVNATIVKLIAQNVSTTLNS